AQASVEDGALVLRLEWQALAPAPGDYTVFVHLTGDTPAPLLQSDGYPLAGLLPPRDWRAGEAIIDERRLTIPRSLRGRPLHVLVGLYDRAAPDTRAPAIGPDGTRLPNDAVAIGDVNVP